jgi:uncharacterized protein YgiM (DUF1202 family)
MPQKTLILILTACLWLTACQPQAPAATPTPSAPTGLEEASLATPTAGFATVRRFEGMQALTLRSQPEAKSAQAGRVLPGEKGKVLGLNAERTWALIKFETQSGWAPVQALDLVLAE